MNLARFRSLLVTSGVRIVAESTSLAFTDTSAGPATRILATISEIEELRDFWTSFPGHRDGDIDFYLEYVTASADTLRPHIIVLYRQGQPCALLAGRLDVTRIDHRLGYLRIPSVSSLSLMFMGFRGEQTAENSTLILTSLLRTLRDGHANCAQIPTLHDSEIYRAALSLPSFLCRDHVPESSRNYILRISGDFRHVFSHFPRTLREQIRRKKRRMNADFNGGVKFVCYTQPAEIDAVIPEIEEIASKTYQRGLGVGFVDNDFMRRRLRFCAVNGWLRVFIAYLGERPAAFTIGTVCNKTYTGDFVGYDTQYHQYSVGILLQNALIEKCCEEGVQVIDYSAGNADYKRRFANDSMKVARVYVFSPHWKGIYLNGVKTLAAAVNKTAKCILAHVGALSEMKKSWRSRAASGTRNI